MNQSAVSRILECRVTSPSRGSTCAELVWWSGRDRLGISPTCGRFQRLLPRSGQLRSTLHDTPCGCSGSTNHIQLWLLFWTGSIRTKAGLAPVVWLGVSCTSVAELVGVLAGDHRRGRHDGRSRRGRRESVARRSLAHGHAFASQRNLHYVSDRKDHLVQATRTEASL